MRTIVQNAWSELDHKIAYKHRIPQPLRRRINTLAALFELADQEFVAIKTETERLEHEALEKHDAPQLPSLTVSSALDAFSFLAVVQPRFPKYNFIPAYIDSFVDLVIDVYPDFTRELLQKAIDAYFDTVTEYALLVGTTYGKAPNPFTLIRHILYLFDRERFHSMLFDKQRNRFTEWLAAKILNEHKA